MSKLNSTPQQEPYSAIVKGELSPEKVLELDHNMVRFIELLIKLDKQMKNVAKAH